MGLIFAFIGDTYSVLVKFTACNSTCYLPKWPGIVESLCKVCYDVPSKLVPTKKHSVINAMKLVKNSKTMCEKLYNLVQDLTGQLKDLIAQKTYDPRGI